MIPFLNCYRNNTSATNMPSRIITATSNRKKKTSMILREMLNGLFCRMEVTQLLLTLPHHTRLHLILLRLTLLLPTPLLRIRFLPTLLQPTRNPQWLLMCPTRCRCRWLQFPNIQLPPTLLLLTLLLLTQFLLTLLLRTKFLKYLIWIQWRGA